VYGLLSRHSLLGFWGRWVGTRVLAIPKGLDIHLFLSSHSFDEHDSGWSYIGVNRLRSQFHRYHQHTLSIVSPMTSLQRCELPN
jgi:hypothetical protein